jgi:nitrite reductase/ring-hydroxylating ferredoxin subunit
MDAIVLAGGIPLPEDPLYPYTQGHSKALVDIAGKPMVLLARVQGQYYAINNVCSHADACLHQGDLRPATWEVRCPLHQGGFDLRTGYPTAWPCSQPVPVYAVRVEGEDILVGSSA